MKRLIALIVLLSFALSLPAAAQDEQMALVYNSRPDVIALYLGDMAYVGDRVELPRNQEWQVVLPSTLIAESLIIMEDGQRVPSFRYLRTPPTASSGVQPYRVVWKSPASTAEDAGDVREIELRYLIHGIGWRPLYDMEILSPEEVILSFEAEIVNNAFPIEGADVRLVSGMVGVDQGYQANMTQTQAAMELNTMFERGGMRAAQVSAHHVYDIAIDSILPGEVTRINLLYETLEARRIIVWDARQGQRTDVIYKVTNSGDKPLAEGIVYAYEDGIFVGSDAVEWTPVGSEGSITVAGMSDVRVRRAEDVALVDADMRDDRYKHDVTLEVFNYREESLDILILDSWSRYAFDESFSVEPNRRPDNVISWDVTVEAGGSVEITYTYYQD